MIEALSDVIRSAAAVQPAHARLRVLRFVGAFPAEGLPLVPEVDADRCDIVIGTASQAVLDDLRGRWPAIDTLECRIVDLDRDLAPDQPEGPAYDIVVLGEGVADAPDPARRLKNARSLLLDDGRLVVLERHASRAADLVFGLEPLWWQGPPSAAAESAVRSRLRSTEAWRGLLAQLGFESVEAIHDIPEAPTGPYVLIARADNARAEHAQRAATPLQQQPQALPQTQTQPAQASAAAPPRTWLIARDAAGYSADLAQALIAALAAAGQRVVTVTAAPIYERVGPGCHALDPCAPAHWERLLAELARRGEEPHAWIHLVGLDLATAGASADARAAAQEARAAVFAAWLQSCARRAIRPDAWVIAAHAGTDLLPDAAQRSAAET